MKNKLHIIEIASDEELELQKHRAQLPEPSRGGIEIGQRFVTVAPSALVLHDGSDWLVQIAVGKDFETWEKKLLRDELSGATFYAWQHVASKFVFR